MQYPPGFPVEAQIPPMNVEQDPMIPIPQNIPNIPPSFGPYQYPSILGNMAIPNMPGAQVVPGGPQNVRTEQFQTPAGMGTRTIIEEPFFIPQPPQRQVVTNVVPRQISIPQAPEQRIIEEVYPRSVVIPKPPHPEVIRQPVQRIVEIPQPPETRVVQQLYRKPVLVPAPVQYRTVYDKVQRSVIVPNPPRIQMQRTEFNQGAIMSGIVPPPTQPPLMNSVIAPPIPQSFPINQINPLAASFSQPPMYPPVAGFPESSLMDPQGIPPPLP